MKGSEYIAVRRLSNKADDTLAEVGETCERVPEQDLPILLAGGKIRPVDADAQPEVAPDPPAEATKEDLGGG